jgi:arsenate reductase
VDIPTKHQITKLCKMLNMRPKDIIRKNEKDFKENNLISIIDNDELLIEKMILFPKIIERPIIVIGNKAVIGRPPENILDILKDN